MHRFAPFHFCGEQCLGQAISPPVKDVHNIEENSMLEHKSH